MNQLILRTPDGEVKIGVGKKVGVKGQNFAFKIVSLAVTSFDTIIANLIHADTKEPAFLNINIADLIPPPQPKTVPLTDADVLAMCRKGGVEFKTKDGDWLTGNSYWVTRSGCTIIWNNNLHKITHYRLASENWEIEHEMTKTV